VHTLWEPDFPEVFWSVNPGPPELRASEN
jgi:hypothetical protein